MSDHFNEYQLRQHFEGRREQLMTEAKEARLKAEVVRAARQQAQLSRPVTQVPNLLLRLRAMLRIEAPVMPECPPLESTAP